MRRLAEIATFNNFPSFVINIGNISYFYSEQLLVIYFCNCFYVYFYLFRKFKWLKGKILSDWMRKLEQKRTFCDWKRQCVNGPKMELCFGLDTNFVQKFHKRKPNTDRPRQESNKES